MTLQIVSSPNPENWNAQILQNPDGGNIFQGYEFAMQKKFGGWTPLFASNETISLTILQKNVPLLGALWYISKGPGVASTKQLDDLLSELKNLAKKHSVFAIKIEPELLKKDETMATLLKMGLKKVSPIQPNASTVLIDLAPPLDDILAGLNQKGRHAIRRAERDGVTIKRVPTSDTNCEQMFTLLSETAAGSFRIRSYNYYKTFWQRYSDAKQGQLFFAYTGDRLVAGAYAMTFGSKSTYKDGASVRERTVYGASHLLQWHVIQWAKESGSLIHDLCGAPPSDQINNPDHPHYGIGRFKTSFNKQVTDYVGAFDIVIRPKQYQLWTSYGERIAQRVHSALHHENYY